MERINLQQAEKELSTIVTDEKRLKELQKNVSSKRKTSSQLFDEANKRLKTAIEKNDMTGISVAKAMLDSYKSVRKEEEAKTKEVDAVQKSVDTKKTKLISEYFKKKN